MAPCPKPYSNKGSSPPQMELERATRSPNCVRASRDPVPPRKLVETRIMTPCPTPRSKMSSRILFEDPIDLRMIPARSCTVEKHAQTYQFHPKSCYVQHGTKELALNPLLAQRPGRRHAEPLHTRTQEKDQPPPCL